MELRFAFLIYTHMFGSVCDKKYERYWVFVEVCVLYSVLGGCPHEETAEWGTWPHNLAEGRETLLRGEGREIGWWHSLHDNS